LPEDGKISAMSTKQGIFYLLKPCGDSIAINRTIEVIGDGDEPFVVLVIDRDYQYDPSSQSQTIVFRETYDLINDATAAAEVQVSVSLANGFLHNRMGMI
jgi:hypothetical protein